MVLEKGGRADKAGNRYELKCIIFELLDVIDEKNYSVTVEAIGDDEKGTDIVVVKRNGEKDFIQCKASNNIKDSWSILDLKRIGLLNNWKFQLDRDSSNSVSLMSPLGSPVLETLIDRAKNTGLKYIDFYTSQICTSEKIKKEYNYICNALGLNNESEDNKNIQNIEKSIDYLKRISVKQFPISNLDRMIDDKIEFLFSSEISIVRNVLISFIVDGDILGNDVTLVGIKKYLDEQNLVLRMVESDCNKDFQRMNSLNEEYSAGFIPINDKLIIRSEFDKCIDFIRQEKSFVISGQAGVGKSGCTEAIIHYCISEDIPYIAIKLDRKIPYGSCVTWGKNLGFSCSFVYALHRLSVDKNAVIILDQLDALRWTQSNSAQAIDICMELIRKVELLNQERDKKISIVFVCRKYDIENDNNIKRLFEKYDNNHVQIEWAKINIGEFDDSIVEEIVGKNYNTMSTKLKRLVKIPSNLYIWGKIENKESINDCVTTGQLINIWYKQICRNYIKEDITGKLVYDLVEKLEKRGLIYIPKMAIEIDLSIYEYLVSAGMIVEDDKKIGFVHQSILDYFISEKMIKEYFGGYNVDKIIGPKNMQTPAKRYQVQMFLQNILEYDTNVFLSIADSILSSEDIRYYIKYLVYECIGQIDKPDRVICDYIIAKISDSDDINKWLNNVIYGKEQFISLLLDNNILERWFNEEGKKNIVFNLLQSVSKDLTNEEIIFMENHSFINEEDDKKFSSVLWYEISMDSDCLFEYRIKLYSKYPELLKNIYLQLKKLMPKYEKRVVRIIALWHENKDIIEKKPINGIGSIVEDNSDYMVEDGVYIIQNLLKYVPQDYTYTIKYSAWSNHYYHDMSSEILIKGLIKKANISIINSNPKLFWDYYGDYLGKGFLLFDELILHGFKYLPKDYSDKIMLYICQDFDRNIYDVTSGVVDQLQYTKEAIKIHSQWCSDEVFLEFETKLMNYISKSAVDRYNWRIENNSTKKYGVSYESFWGELQYELLKEVQYERLSTKGKELLEVLKRKFKIYYSPYLNSNMHSGTVYSPVTGKNIGVKQWKQIITNKKLMNQNNHKSKMVKGGFVESSPYMFATDFHKVVSKNPEKMINMVLANKKNIIPFYIDSLYAGVALSENINDIKQDVFETLFEEFPCEMEGQRVIYFCEILEKRSELNWSCKTYEKLNEIVAKHHMYVDYDDSNNYEMDGRSLFEHALNCVKGHAARTIEQLIWHNDSLFSVFKESIELLTQDKDDYVKMASLFPLWPAYNIERHWAQEKIVNLYEHDIRFVRFTDSKDMLCRLYHVYKNKVLEIISKCVVSNDKEVVQVGCYCMCDLYIQYDEFEEFINNVNILNEDQTKYILEMAIAYLRPDEYKQKAKNLICKYKETKYDVEFPLSRIFFDEMVDLKSDKNFICEVVSSSFGRKIIHAFVEFIEKSTYSIKEFGNIILDLCKEMMNEDVEIINKQWGLAEELSKLVISLYDECANTNNQRDKQYADECLDIWDYMFENQIGYTRELSQQLMER